MSLGSIEVAGGELHLSGVLDYRTGARLREQGAKLIGQLPAAQVIVDCSAIQSANSVGISLLLALSRDAKKAGKAFGIRALPQELSQIAEVCGVAGLLSRA
ncbi:MULTISPECIES: STAS domain-containing protein [Pseudomonas]|uniref:STAS domain-containing protein n=1 Tax=Pseudomonas quercus TaxID=2722792 RepID=A0ABX0YDG2_9PSED|nr:STAS domain-containing protein [Pseudomonas sp. LY10J]MBF7142822.1 anti-sigma factor antagonist [Pseudomonas sp. LY10J]NJP01370.1 STAS domain-containing protein [Pseudomonas quercus]